MLALANTYGVITIEKAHSFFEKQMFKIDIKELYRLMKIKTIFEGCNIHVKDNKMLLCSMEFDDEETAIAFYNSQKGNYKKFTKEEYEMISNETYIEELKPYKDFIKYLCNNFIGIEKDIDYIKDNIVLDYIYTAQTSVERANKNFESNIKRILETDETIIDKLLDLIKKIYSKYPKWINRGKC